ncbi:uncharacterized protein LOC117569367 [Drosophila albomicans]|uniref:Uncharacterized protein LOC117569367 n=2 Tax=nasuta subgroup TaxID=32307 RepID=A0A9C6WEK5_DROAB|nr:uncharacterized protein LOC117569367 [Drosophila albomicans]
MLQLRSALSFAIFSLTLLSIGINPSEGERRVDFVGTNYTFNPAYFTSFSITIVNKSISMDMVLLKPILRGFKVHIDYQLRMANAKSYQSIFSRHVDVCAMVSTVKDGLLKSWFKSMASHGNFMANCPVEVGHYYLHNWRMGSSMMHQFLYPGEYRSRVNFFYGKYKTKTEDRVLSIVMESLISN